MALANVAFTGFSVISAGLLFLAYVLLRNVPGKSAYSVSACAALLAALALIQVGHLEYFLGGPEPLDSFFYRLGLFVTPSMFYCFGRWVILPNEPFRAVQLAYLLPILLPFVLPLEIALPILFAFGAVNSLWLGYVVYGMRDRRKQFRFEFFYFCVMSVFAVIVLGLGFLLPRIDHDYFYYFYSSAVGAAFAIMIVALVANPDLMGDLFEAARVKYGASTLREVDVEGCLKKLEQLMTESRTYANESLSLSSLAAELGISSHQLSELVNTRLGMGFARYVRECRVRAGKALLISAPTQSILSISMDLGFRSQSAFYAAFKEVTGQSPGDYRKTRRDAGPSHPNTPE